MVIEMKRAFNRLITRLDTAEESIRLLEVGAIEII